MICRLDVSQYDDLLPICRGDVFGARILSGVQMYGQYPFLDVWVQQQDGMPTAAVLKLDSALTVTVCAPPDWQELREFFRMVPAETLLGEHSVLQRLHADGSTGAVLCRPNVPKANPQHLQPPALRDVHTLLCLCETDSFTPPVWEPFYLDLSHRLRHGGAHLQTIWQNGILTACAMTVAETPELAVLGAVAVHPGYRRKGLGRQVVRRLLDRLAQPQAAVFCTPSHYPFYESLGFCRHAQWIQSSL